MAKSVLIIQRFYYNFREGFYEYLSDIKYDFKLINATSSRGRVKVHDDVKSKPFIEKILYFFIADDYTIFPFLFFSLLRINPRIIVTEGGQNTINNLQVFLYCKIFNRKYIIWDLGKGYADFKDSILRRLYIRIYKYLLKHAYYIFGYNSQSKIYFCSLGIKESKIVVLNNTIDTRKIKKIKSTNIPQIPPELSEQVKKGYTFLIFVGTLLRSKNIEHLPELMRLLGDRYYLIIVGDGSQIYKSELEMLFCETNHIFVGYKRNEQLINYYAISSFSILPGLGGLSINQSMAYGVPVICSGADGAEKDLVITNETGYIYKDLIDAHDYIVSKNSADWLEMGKRAESFLNTNHSVESMMDTFIQYCSTNSK
jgi:glycosyltransferase involved in cell wall biosynthesis